MNGKIAYPHTVERLGEPLRQVAYPLRGARRAFSLLEVLIVIAILLAIGGIVAVNLIPQKDQADADLVTVQIDQIDSAMATFKLDMGRYPTEEEGIRALWNKDAIEDEAKASRWKGPYTKAPLPKDSFGNDWVYHFPSEARGQGYYDLISLGPDSEEGTADDITNFDRFKDESGEVSDEFDDFTPAEDAVG